MNIGKVSRSFTISLLLCLTTLQSSVYAEPLWVFFHNNPARNIDKPLSAVSINEVTSTGAKIRTVSRYFQAVSVDWQGDPRILESLPSVESVRPVRSLRRIHHDQAHHNLSKKTISSQQDSTVLNYGTSYDQLNILNIPAVHNLGYTGGGVKIGILDTGFNIRGIECLENAHIEHTRNFIYGGEDVTGDTHGCFVFGCLAGAADGEYYGAAFGASYFLAVTDHPDTETRADEDRWVAAVEWCDSLGADIISSSLVYNEFDSIEESYVTDDMDGRTSLVARAAEIAVSRGIVVVNSAGNEGLGMWRIIATPGDAEHVIAVGAVNYNNLDQPIISGFSSRGPTADGRIKPDIVAPGGYVKVPRSGTPKDYIYVNGTSYAAPLISGLCALLLEAHPDWTPADVMEALRQTASDLGKTGPDNDYGWGLPDALEALNYSSVHVARDNSRQGSILKEFTLNSPYPNPFNSVVTIPLTVFSGSQVTVHVYDITGRRVTTLWNTNAVPGNYCVVWNGEGCSSGTYLIKAATAQHHVMKKITFLK